MHEKVIKRKLMIEESFVPLIGFEGLWKSFRFEEKNQTEDCVEGFPGDQSI